MTIKKKFYFNGQPYNVYKNITIELILNYFNYQNNLFVIEYNSIICTPNELKNIEICNKDKIELITIVGGG